MRFKIGDSFIIAGEIDGVDDEDNAITDFTGWTGRSWIADKDNNLIQELTFEWVNAAARIARISHMDTAQWPEGKAYQDIELTKPGSPPIVVSTDTFSYEIYAGPTGNAT